MTGEQLAEYLSCSQKTYFSNQNELLNDDRSFPGIILAQDYVVYPVCDLRG